MTKPTDEELEQMKDLKTPEDVRAKYGEPVRVVEFPNSLYMFYEHFHFQFKRGEVTR
jgi:hypothetical protein